MSIMKADPSHEPSQIAKTRPQPGGFEITIYEAWCKSCGICAEMCARGVLTCDSLGTPHATNQAACMGCTSCVLHCPDFAITCSVKKKTEEHNG